MKKQKFCALIVITACLLPAGCREYSPKPTGHFRIDLPEPVYHTREFSKYAFQLSGQAAVETAAAPGEGEFFNIVYPELNAQIYCSYFPIKKEDLAQFSEESRKFVYLHATKAEAIRQHVFENQKQRVFGMRYEIRGNVASPTQFVLTDSTRSFFRGALYFDNIPNQDSIAPVLEYINNDILMLIESFRWKM